VTRFVRRSALPAGAALVVALVAGCSAGPAKPGAAAIVGDTTIPVDALQGQLASLAAARPQASRQALQAGKLPQTSRELLSYKVRGALLAEVKSRRALSVPEGKLAKSVTAAEERGAASLTPAERAQLHNVVTDQLLQLALAKDTLGKLSMDVDLLPARNRADAEATARRLARSPSALAGVTNSDSALHAHYTGVQIAQSKLSLLPLLGAPDRAVLAFPVNSSGATLWVVGYVHDRTVGDAAAGSKRAIQSIDPKVLIASGRLLLAPTARNVGVTVNPRYGEFDLLSMSVVGSHAKGYGIELPARSATS
jgi:hypothetical protein